MAPYLGDVTRSLAADQNVGEATYKGAGRFILVECERSFFGRLGKAKRATDQPELVELEVNSDALC